MDEGSERYQPVVVVRTDTHLLVMLVARATSSMDMFMLCHRNPITLYSVEQLHQALGSTRQHLLFIHAITGCDTTSALYGQGKVKALKLAQKQDGNLCSHVHYIPAPVRMLPLQVSSSYSYCMDLDSLLY